MNTYQLPENKLQELRKAHRHAKKHDTPRVADRIKAIYLLGSGWRICDICEALLIDENMVYRSYERYQLKGLDGLLKNNHKGSESFLTLTETEELDDYLMNNPCRTTKQVIDYVDTEFDVTYSVSGMNALLKRLGYTYKKPRAIPGKSDKEAQADFLKKYREIRAKMKKEDSLFFMDGVHPQHNPIVQYGWFKKGSKQPLRTNTQYHRTHINGAIDIDRLDVIAKSSYRLDEEATLDMLEELRKKRPIGQLYLVLDNAGYYNTSRVCQFAEALGIILLYLPPYSPNLNLIERLWGFMQRDILYNHYYPTFSEFMQSCTKFFVGLKWRKSELRGLMTENFETLIA